MPLNKVQKEDDRYVRSREEDRSTWAKLTYYREKYWPIFWAIIIFLLAIGFDFKTPKQIVQDLQGQITANKKNVDSVLTPQVKATNDKLDILLRLNCNSKINTEAERQLSGLYCPH